MEVTEVQCGCSEWEKGWKAASLRWDGWGRNIRGKAICPEEVIWGWKRAHFKPVLLDYNILAILKLFLAPYPQGSERGPFKRKLRVSSCGGRDFCKGLWKDCPGPRASLPMNEWSTDHQSSCRMMEKKSITAPFSITNYYLSSTLLYAKPCSKCFTRMN